MVDDIKKNGIVWRIPFLRYDVVWFVTNVTKFCHNAMSPPSEYKTAILNDVPTQKTVILRDPRAVVTCAVCNYI
jgi:hypothetical protein